MSASAARPPCHPAKENPDAAYHAGAQERAASDGRIVSGRLVTGTATLLPAHQLAPLLPTKCELLHIGLFFVIPVHSARCTVRRRRRQPRASSARRGLVPAPTALAQPKIWAERPLAHSAAFPSPSSSCKAIGRWSCPEVSSSCQGMRHGQATTLRSPAWRLARDLRPLHAAVNCVRDLEATPSASQA